MHILRDLPIKTLICVFITLFFVSCGQDVVDEVPVPLPDDELNQQDPSTRECPPEQSLNPITGECVDPPDEADDPNQTSPGLNQDEHPSDPDENQAGGDDDPCGFGSIIGQACGTSGAHLPAAQVTVTWRRLLRPTF